MTHSHFRGQFREFCSVRVFFPSIFSSCFPSKQECYWSISVCVHLRITAWICFVFLFLESKRRQHSQLYWNLGRRLEIHINAFNKVCLLPVVFSEQNNIYTTQTKMQTLPWCRPAFPSEFLMAGLRLTSFLHNIQPCIHFEWFAFLAMPFLDTSFYAVTLVLNLQIYCNCRQTLKQEALKFRNSEGILKITGLSFSGTQWF